MKGLHRFGAVLLPTAIAISLVAAVGAATPATSPLVTLIVGGGPDRESNQVAIESNVRYVRQLTVPDATRVLFANGRTDRAVVQYAKPIPEKLDGRALLEFLLRGTTEDLLGPEEYRNPNVGGPLHGALAPEAITEGVRWCGGRAGSHPNVPVLLYFTGHGSNAGDGSTFDLWNEEELGPRALAREIAQLPAHTPVALVMVQCFAGGFANVLFKDGDPGGAPVERDIAGFFAATEDRMAAGCSAAINEADYRDFSSYFFKALSGRDRMGRSSTGADYDGDGQVGMNEAFCYAMIHDESIDVPTRTSDAFLRRYVREPDERVLATPWPQVISMAAEPEKSALGELAQKLALSGDDRVERAWTEFKRRAAAATLMGEESMAVRRRRALTERLRRAGRDRVVRAWPGLRRPNGRAFAGASRQAAVALDSQLAAGQWSALQKAVAALRLALQQDEAEQIKSARLLRFVRLAKSVVLAHDLAQQATPAICSRFSRLRAWEACALPLAK